MKFLTAVETAKLIRKELKKNFPTIKFSVKTKNAININWIDGPSDGEVDNVVAAFSGTSFNSIIDMTYNTTSWLLPDGSVKIANSGHDGMTEAVKSEKPHADAIEVSFGASFIFTNRSYGLEALTMITKDVVKYYGLEMPEISVSDYDGHAYISDMDLILDNLGERLSTLVYQQSQKMNLTDLNNYEPLFVEIIAEEFDIELDEEKVVGQETDIEIEVVNPIVETAKTLLTSMNYGDALNTLLGGGLNISKALDVLKQC